MQTNIFVGNKICLVHFFCDTYKRYQNCVLYVNTTINKTFMIAKPNLHKKRKSFLLFAKRAKKNNQKYSRYNYTHIYVNIQSVFENALK